MLTPNKQPFHRVAYVDDDEDERETFKLLLEEEGIEDPIAPPGSFTSIDDLVERLLVLQVDGVVCDHRLTKNGFAYFTGAEAVQHLMQASLPAILVTSFKMDIDNDICMFRRDIPALLSRDRAREPGCLTQALLSARHELAGHRESSRLPTRTLVHVVKRTSESGKDVVDAFLPAWNPEQAVRFPVDVAGKMALLLQEDKMFFAQVNIGAEHDRDLFFFDFEEAPELDESDWPEGF